MVGIGAVGKAAFDIFEDVRGAVGMYMFIVEESIQSAMMGCYLLYRAERYSECKALAQWVKTELAEPLLQFSTGAAANLAYPLNLSYQKFAEATLKSLETYLKL